MSRGRLIYPFLAEISYLDTAATEAAGSDTGYDHVFNEPAQLDDGSQVGVDARTEGTRTIRVQVEPAQFDALHKYASGDSRDARVMLVAHYTDLEREGLVSETGDVMLRVNDRLSALKEDTYEQATVMEVPAAPGLYLHEVTPIGWGLGRKRNLLYLDFRARPQAK